MRGEEKAGREKMGERDRGRETEKGKSKKGEGKREGGRKEGQWEIMHSSSKARLKHCSVMVDVEEKVSTEVSNGRWTKRAGKFLHLHTAD